MKNWSKKDIMLATGFLLLIIGLFIVMFYAGTDDSYYYRQEGYEKALEEAKWEVDEESASFRAGEEKGFHDGYEEGRSDGWDEGYEDGLIDGYAKARSEYEINE